MDSFAEFITLDEVVKVLINNRVAQADKRHRDHYFQNMAPGLKSTRLREPNHFVYNLMPPRRTWVTLNRMRRYRRNEENPNSSQRISTYDYNREAIRLTIKRDLKKEVQPEYLRRIKDFIQELKSRCLNEDYVIQVPNVSPKPKNRHGTEMRPICQFRDQYDSVIIILLNRYLTKTLDEFFKPCSYAFRAADTKGNVISHHDTILEIQKFRSLYKDVPIYVAECDMQKFYDTVDHDVVWKEFDRLIKILEQRYPKASYKSVRHLFRSYLDCFYFARDVISLNNNPEYWSKHNCTPGAQYKWLDTSKLPWVNFSNVGVPQGGALSGLIANIVLNIVDTKVVNEAAKDVLYLRYCDDMILMSPKKQHVKWAFKVYKREIRKLKLVPHDPQDNIVYGKGTNYWQVKTKSPYKWDLGKNNATEWLGFVGYELRKSGEIRIRKSTLRKEVQKQRLVYHDDYKPVVSRPLRVGNSSLFNSVYARLIAMSVGKVSLWNADKYRNELCWISGFRMLTRNKYSAKQMKYLDKMRGRAISKIKAQLNNAKHSDSILRPDIRDEERDEFIASTYYGKPFSYYYHYIRMTDL